MTRAALTLLVLFGATSVAAQSQPAPTPQTTKPQSAWDRAWSFSELYRNDGNPTVQRVLLSGRFHYDLAALDADQGDWREANARRFRIGPRITLFKTVTVHTEVDLDLERHDPLYARFTDLYVQWTRNNRFVLTVGKQALPFTLDGATSSRELLTIDRSNLANNIWFPQEYLPGVSVSGRRGLWNYRVGAYSAGAMNRELGEFNGSVATLGVVGYDFSKRVGMREALVTGNYVYQHPDRNNTFSRQLEHIGSVNVRLEDGRFGLRADLAVAAGYLGQPNLTSITAMPFFNITPKLQAVGRYTHVTSHEANGIRLTTYESRVVGGRGDEYNELYLGANYYFYGHRLKLQTGAQWGDMNDRAADGGSYTGVSWVTGLRVGW